jgi:hypothetical protein
LAWDQPFSEWDHAFPDPAMTVAAFDRIAHHATIIECNTESYRRRTATKNRDPETACAKKSNCRPTGHQSCRSTGIVDRDQGDGPEMGAAFCRGGP